VPRQASHPSPLLSPHRSILTPNSASPPYHSQNLFTPHRPSKEAQPHHAGCINRRVNAHATGQPSNRESAKPSANLGQSAKPSHSANLSHHWVEYERFVGAEIPRCCLTKFAPHKALKVIEWCKLTFDESVVLHRVARSNCTVTPRATGLRFDVVPLSGLVQYSNSLSDTPPSGQPIVQDGEAVVDRGGEHLADKSTESFGQWLDRSLPSHFKGPCLGCGVCGLGFRSWGLAFRL